MSADEAIFGWFGGAEMKEPGLGGGDAPAGGVLSHRDRVRGYPALRGARLDLIVALKGR